MKRHAQSHRVASRQFRKGAARVHRKNMMSSAASYVMRGGIRL